MFAQLITPTPDIPCRPGMCLEYVRETFGLPIRYGSASEAWNNSPSQHPDQDFPAGLDVPVWFSLEAIPAGHVALRMSDGTVYSSSDNTPVPHHHPTLQDLLDYYAHYNLPLTYLGWTEDVAGYPVAAPLKGNRMATLDLDDLKAIQAFANTNGDRVVNELHAQVAALGAQLAHALNIDPQALAQALLAAGNVTITPKA